MPTPRPQPLSYCLYDAFSDPDHHPPQAARQLWAIREGARRGRQWREVRARKEHSCVRGCAIIAGDLYFHYALGGPWNDAFRLCAGCMAMHLYFSGAEEEAPVRYTHWDPGRERPVAEEQVDQGQRRQRRGRHSPADPARGGMMRASQTHR
ncbi:MAG: hypothetical protein R3272_01685 [Candidatus Promineifilaceae bacterium]|nr:hypothetical protein [Candidatus Promineifilaceae bacterium]